MRPVVIVFAKAPVAGRVKTRLIPRLGAEGAAALHDAFVRDLIGRLLVKFEVELHTDMETDAWLELAVARRLQVNGDLGVRMLGALREALGEGRPSAMIVGADAPGIPLEFVERLLQGGSDVGLGPAEDGGYWGIAARRVTEQMFRGVEWGTAEAMRQTQAACRAEGLTVELGDVWYDIDDSSGLDRLSSSPEINYLPIITNLLIAISKQHN
jgi:rSAM/selenodomain-associated transferase 1